MPTPPRFNLTHMDQIPAVPCPCGSSQRAFADPGSPVSVHVVTISADARTHYHKRMTETYYVLEGAGHIELDGESFPLRPGSVVMIHPLCRHRAVGQFKILNIAVPAFDESDEHFD